MSKRITYLLGAGASYHACPIWKEQGERMIKLTKLLLPDDDPLTYTYRKPNPTAKEALVHSIGYFGYKANEFNTVDAYAKKLYLNDSFSELNDLKTAISSFFTIWQLTHDSHLKTWNDEDKRYTNIDQRYINLLATCIEKDTDNRSIKLNDNIRFITWNYDLQIELAYKMFLKHNCEIKEIHNSLPFIPHISDANQNLSICHLNGFHGFYRHKKGFDSIFDRPDKTSLEEIISAISFAQDSTSKGQICFGTYLNYAWEKEPSFGLPQSLSEIARSQAKNIFSETDILVIIGYSFPPFNREVDKELFNAGRNRISKIIYQDPNASVDFLSDAYEFDKDKIEIQKDNMDQFVLPSLF